ALTPEQRRAALGQFERAGQAIAEGQRDYALHLLLSCCKLDPANLVFRQALRRFLKEDRARRGRENLLAWLGALLMKTKLKAAKQAGDFVRVLEYGEELLARRPGDIRTHMDMAEAAEALGLIPLAVWLLEQVWQRDRHTPPLNRLLARLYEKQGNYAHAGMLVKLVLQPDPNWLAAHHKVQHLAAKETIVRGQYETAVREMG